MVEDPVHTAEYVLPRNLVVGTMCHCDDPDECYDHWEFYKVDDPSAVPPSGHVGRGRELTENEMRAIAALVATHIKRSDDAHL